MGQAATLGIATMACVPFCFFNLVNVLLSFICAVLGFQIKHVEPEEALKKTPEKATWHGTVVNGWTNRA